MDWEGKIPRNIKENFEVRFKQRAERIYPFHEICDITAKQIGSKYKNLHLAFSGGADSECVANALHRNNIDFVPVIMTLVAEQTPETDYALRWCKHRNIKPMIVHYGIDVIQSGGAYRKIMLEARARLKIGVTPLFLVKEIEKLGGDYIAGMQVEYHPDAQFSGDEGIPADYKGFVINECDAYSEIASPDRHPWAFFYWTPEMLASTVYHWDTSLDMTRAKAKLYDTELRPKMLNTAFDNEIGFLLQRKQPRTIFGTIDSALIGDKEELLSKLL